MAKINIKGIKELSNKLKRNLAIQVNKLFRNKALRERIGRIIVDDIKKNVNFGPPSKKTLEWRKRYGPLNNTDPKYSIGKLNATFTGELLEDLANNVKGITTEKSFHIEHSDKRHKKYTGVTKKIGSRSKYIDISRGLIEDMGYNYFNISKDAEKRITQEVQEELVKLLSQ